MLHVEYKTHTIDHRLLQKLAIHNNKTSYFVKKIYKHSSDLTFSYSIKNGTQLRTNPDKVFTHFYSHIDKAHVHIMLEVLNIAQ